MLANVIPIRCRAAELRGALDFVERIGRIVRFAFSGSRQGRLVIAHRCEQRLAGCPRSSHAGYACITARVSGRDNW